jgi:hypothetical protein
MSTRPDPFFKPIQETGPASGWAKVRIMLLEIDFDFARCWVGLVDWYDWGGFLIVQHALCLSLSLSLSIESLRVDQRQSWTKGLATIFGRVCYYLLGIFPIRCRKQEANRTKAVGTARKVHSSQFVAK